MSRYLENQIAWGKEVGRGLRGVVYGLDSQRVIKVPMAGTPDYWLEVECSNLLAAKDAGAPCPGSASVIQAHGRAALASERIEGHKFASVVVDEPLQAEDIAVQLVELQLALFRCSVSMTVPRQQDRLASKIMEAASLYDLDVASLLAFIDLSADSGDNPQGLCHGDVHPDNVLVGEAGLVLVDWFDASRGLLIAEFARTSVLLESNDTVSPARTLSAAYSDVVAQQESFDLELFERWRLVQKVARLAELLDRDRLAEIRQEISAV